MVISIALVLCGSQSTTYRFTATSAKRKARFAIDCERKPRASYLVETAVLYSAKLCMRPRPEAG